MLTQENISLQLLTERDVPAIARFADNYLIWRNVRDRMPRPYTEADAAFFVQLKKTENPACTFGIHYQDSLAGVIGLELREDIHRLNAEVGYWIGEPYWNKGIATRAVQIMTRYAFGELQLHRLFAGVFHTNPASARVLAKAGFQLEYIARQAVIKEGNLLDEHLYVLRNASTEQLQA